MSEPRRENRRRPLARRISGICSSDAALHFFFEPPFFACDRSEPATVFSDFDDFELLSSFDAVDAAFFPVAMEMLPVSIEWP
jgi:hypothetical protein